MNPSLLIQQPKQTRLEGIAEDDWEGPTSKGPPMGTSPIRFSFSDHGLVSRPIVLFGALVSAARSPVNAQALLATDDRGRPIWRMGPATQTAKLRIQ